MKTEAVETQPKTIWIEMDECISHTAVEALKLHDKAARAASRLSNGVTYEMMCRDVPPWRSEDGESMLPAADAFGMAPATLAYQLGVGKMAEQTGLARYAAILPTRTLALTLKHLASRYCKKRRGAFQHQNDSIPLMKFPVKVMIPADKVELTAEKKNGLDTGYFLVRYPLMRLEKGKTLYMTERLKRCRGDRNTSSVKKGEPPLLELLRRGPEDGGLKMGGMTLSYKRHRISSKQAKENGIPVHYDPRGNRYYYSREYGLTAHFTVNSSVGRRGYILLHTDPKKFLVARFAESSRTARSFWRRDVARRWGTFSPAQMADIITYVDQRVREMREDSKYTNRGVRTRMSAFTEKNGRLVLNFIHCETKTIVSWVTPKTVREVYFLCGDKGLPQDAPREAVFMPHFPWHLFFFVLKYKLRVAGIELKELDIHDYRPDKFGYFDFDAIWEKRRQQEAREKAEKTRRDNEQYNQERIQA